MEVEEEEDEGEIEEIDYSTKKLKVIVTGSCHLKGIGLQLVKMLLSRGHHVIITNRVYDEGKKAFLDVKSFCEENGLDKSLLSIHFLDITNKDEDRTIEKFVQWTVEKHETVDVLVNNASCCVYGKEDVELNFETNFFGTRDLTDSLLEKNCISKNGKIINVTCALSRIYNMDLFLKYRFLNWTKYSQIENLINKYYEANEIDDWWKWRLWGGWEHFRAFSVSKLALNGYTRYLSNKASQTVFCVCPGWCKTEKGGRFAKRTPEDGAKTILDHLLSNDRDMNGGFYDRFDGPVEY